MMVLEDLDFTIDVYEYVTFHVVLYNIVNYGRNIGESFLKMKLYAQSN